MRQIWRLGCALRLVWQGGPAWTVASVLLLIAQGALPLLALYILKWVVDVLAAGASAPDKSIILLQAAWLIVLAGIVALISAVCRALGLVVSEAQAQAVADHVHDLLHAKSTEVDLAYYENSQYYDTLYRAQQEAPFRPPRIVNNLGQVGQNGMSLLAVAGLLFSFHWGVAVTLFAAAVPGVLVRLRYAGKLYDWQRQRTPAEREAWYWTWLLTRDVYAKEIRVFNLGPLLMRRFREVRRRLRRERLDIMTKRSVAELATQAGAILAVFGSSAFIVYRTVYGLLTLGDLVMFYQAFQRAQGFLQEMFRGLAGLYEDNLFLAHLEEFLDLERTVVEPIHPKPVPRPIHTGITFDRVGFRYPAGARNILQEITLSIRPREHVAFVGENGSGKTTLVKLLCRLYDPTEGVITIDGVDLRQFNTATLRREIGVIFQDYARYQLTARENIGFGNTDLLADHEQIQAAARQAGVHEVIARLKHDYNTRLGKWFEEGEELSIGEWQKVALARAFLRGAQIIVLDEPTSALDAKAEYEVFQKFHQLAQGRTAILISHRLSTIRMADCIYVLEDGRIVEKGTHAELIRCGGRYAQLFALQAQSYQ